jgi:hypothetical protein
MKSRHHYDKNKDMTPSCPRGIIATDKHGSSQIRASDRDQCGDEDEPKKNLHILASSHSCLAAVSLILLSLMGVFR